MPLSRRSASAEPMLSAEEEMRLIRAWKANGDISARDRIVRSYARLCYSIASRWSSNPDHIDDLAQEGAFGIMRALERFDPERGTRFSTYSRPWVQNFVSTAASRIALVVDLPSRTYVEARGGKLIGVNDIAVAASAAAISLDASVGEDAGETLFDKLASRDPSPEDVCEAEVQQRHYASLISDALSVLTPRERLVIERRALSEFPETLDMIAVDLHVTRERVRQIEVIALRRIRDAVEAAGFDPSALG